MVAIIQRLLLRMHKSIYIYSSSNYHHAITNGLPSLNSELKAITGANIRRVDRLTQLALIGGFQCKSGITFPKSTGLYLSSIYGSISNTAAVLSEIYQQGQLPKPLNFINSVSNAACFYLAKYLGILASNQFVSRDHFTLEAGLKLACIDLEIGNIEAALVGVVCEVDQNQKNHRQRLNIDQKYKLAEGSHWLYLTHHCEKMSALAKLTHVTEPIMGKDLDTYLKSISGTSPTLLKVGFGDAVGKAKRKNILHGLNAKEVDFIATPLRHEFTTALQICGFIEDCKTSPTPFRYLYIDTDGNNRWSIIGLEKETSANA